MARKTFISYKYSDSHELRDKIIKALGDDAKFYQGERGFNKISNNDEYIENYLKDMIFKTSVTIVILSPGVLSSEWVEWEIKYSLKEISRDGLCSKRNGIVCVVKSTANSYLFNSYDYNWAKKYDGSWNYDLFFNVIKKNVNNKKPLRFEQKNSSYIVFAKEQEFLLNPNKFIEEAYKNSLNSDDFYISIEC